MNTILSEINVKHAKKDYSCDACYFLLQEHGKLQSFIEEYGPKLSQQELLALRDIERKNFKIKKGEPYFKQAGVCDDDFYVFKANEKIHNVCLKLNIYDTE